MRLSLLLLPHALHCNSHNLPLSSLPLLHRTMAAAAVTNVEPISPSNTRVGWIGTGVMGRSMCGHLIKAGYKVTVFNRTLSKAQPLIDMGARLAQSPLAVASQSDVVFSIVGFPSDVRSVRDIGIAWLKARTPPPASAQFRDYAFEAAPGPPIRLGRPPAPQPGDLGKTR